MSILRYTGHPFLDVGVATLTAMSKKNRPEDVGYAELESAAEYLKDVYSHIPKVQNQLNTVFQGSHFTQPAKSLSNRLEYADRLMFGFRTERETISGVACTFFPELPAYLYAHRQYFPLLNGIGLLNFLPPGCDGIPISGVGLLALRLSTRLRVLKYRLLPARSAHRRCVTTIDPIEGSEICKPCPWAAAAHRVLRISTRLRVLK